MTSDETEMVAAVPTLGEVPDELRVQLAGEALLEGDLSSFSKRDLLIYYLQRCKAANLDPRTEPFQLIREGKGAGAKLSMYARASATEQIANREGIGVQLVKWYVTPKKDDVPEGSEWRPHLYYHVRAQDAKRRMAENIAVVPLYRRWFEKREGGPQTNRWGDEGEWKTVYLDGDDFANAHMKCFTKASRRVVKGMAGLGVPDESELDTMGPDVQRVSLSDKMDPIAETKEAPEPGVGDSAPGWAKAEDATEAAAETMQADWMAQLDGAATPDDLQVVFDAIAKADLRPVLGADRYIALQLRGSARRKCLEEIRDADVLDVLSPEAQVEMDRRAGIAEDPG